MAYLRMDTQHGESYLVEVPNLIGLKTSQLEETLSPLELEFQISDTVFSEKGAKGTVLRQNPVSTKVSKQKVKKGRKIYLTIVSPEPKLVLVPKLNDKSRRHAEGVLKIVGFKSKVKYKPYDLCNDCVIEVLYKNKPLKKGAKLPKGETITLVLGQKSGEKVPVADLMGLTIQEAEQRLSNSSLTMYTNFENCKTKKDSASAVIYRQSPSQGEIAAGSEIIVWLTNDKTILDQSNEKP